MARILYTVGFFLLAVLPYYSLSQQTDTVAATVLPELVVTAGRQQSDRAALPEAITVTDQASILKSQLRTAPEALSNTPGVFVQKTNHGGGSPFLRGLTGNQTLLLIDGIRLSNATTRYGPNQYFNTLDVFSLSKIEVLRGNGSVQYGSDAIGGTIQAFSRDPSFSDKPLWRNELLSRISTHGMEQSLHADAGYGSRKVAVRAGAGWRNFGDLVGGDSSGRQSPSGYRELDFDMKTMLALSPVSKLTLAYQHTGQHDVWVYHKVVLENYEVNLMEPQKRDLAYARYQRDLKNKLFNRATVTAAFQHTEEGREILKKGSYLLRNENDRVKSFSISMELYSASRGPWSSGSGIEVYHDLVRSRRTDQNKVSGEIFEKKGLYPDRAQMTSLAAFSLHTLELKNWRITAGVRYNRFVIKVSDSIQLTTSTPVGNLALMRKLNSHSGVFLSVISGFRAPNIDDLGSLGIVDFRYETPDYSLKPEHSVQFQAGYKYSSARIRGDFFLYQNQLFDLIVRTRVEGDSIDGYPVYRKQNAEKAFIRGLETNFEIELNKSWFAEGSMAYTYGQNLTRSEPLRRIPPLFGRIGIEYRAYPLLVNFEWLSAGKQDRLAAGDVDDNRIPDGGTAGWSIYNLHLGYEWHSIGVKLSLLNLLNRDYRYHGSGVNGTGRSAFLSVIFRMKRQRQ